jgi:hypothetical protein
MRTKHKLYNFRDFYVTLQEELGGGYWRCLCVEYPIHRGGTVHAVPSHTVLAHFAEIQPTPYNCVFRIGGVA